MTETFVPDLQELMHPAATGTHPGRYMASGFKQGRSRLGSRGRRFLLPLSFLCVCVLPSHALLNQLKGGDAKGAEHKQIEQLEKQWQTAILMQDNASIAPLLAESYIGIGPDGTISNKSEEMEARANGQERLQKYELLDQKIRIYGTTAVVTSRVRIEGVYSGQPLLGEYRYTRVWSLNRGQWHVVSFEASRIHDASARR